jgi:murein DD-endopeptidase MepM/ murein hydrolase activator NlpD
MTTTAKHITATRSTLCRVGSSSALILVLCVLAGCERVEEIRDSFIPATPHEAYAHALTEAGLSTTALGRDWQMVADRALRQPLQVSTPFQEAGYLPPEEANALSYRFSARRGQAISAAIAMDDDSGTRIFVDLYRVPRDSSDELEHVAHSPDTLSAIEHEPRRTADYIIRFQPELLRGGRYTLTIVIGPSLGFPVRGARDEDIHSFFGDTRDGGRRDHHGIDIFAPRRTPAIAAASGIATRVSDTEVGGKVVWIRDEKRGQNLYYAHLDSQLVQRGDRVELGDTVGLIGNTGNARTTPPHLHFGVYSRGPVDPLPFVQRIRTTPAKVTADTAAIGSWVRTSRHGLQLRSAPSTDALTLRELPRYTPMRVFGGSGSWYRVRLPDGTIGFVTANLLEAVDRPLRGETLATARAMHARPWASAAVVAELAAGEEVNILGQFGTFLLVAAPDGRHAWLELD